MQRGGWLSAAMLATGVTAGSAWAAAGGAPGIELDPGPLNVLVTDRCSATMISRRAAVSSASCLKQQLDASPATAATGRRIEFRQAFDREKRALGARVISFLDDAPAEMRAKADFKKAEALGIGDLALVLLDDELPVSEGVDPTYAIPPYWLEFLWISTAHELRASDIGRALAPDAMERTRLLKVYGRDNLSREPRRNPSRLLAFQQPTLKAYAHARKDEPETYGQVLDDLLEKVTGVRFSAEEIADFVLPQSDVFKDFDYSNIGDDGQVRVKYEVLGSAGAGLFADTLRDEDPYVLIGVATDGPYEIRLSNYWPWIVKTLLAHGRKDEALAIAGRLLRGYGHADPAPTISDRSRCTRVGQIYADVTASGNKDVLSFYRLMQHPWRESGKGGGFIDQCTSFANAGAAGSAWEPLGQGLPSATQGRALMFSWLYDGSPRQTSGKPVIGGHYGYLNPTNASREVFRLKATASDGRLTYFPLDGRSNDHWEFIGNRLPTPRAMRWLDAAAAVADVVPAEAVKR
ncbi:hypothetical protein CDL60_21070 [Roseateles noduli]|nr:hypothetical protein CDL60_21070 [Roseateles noduli]